MVIDLIADIVQLYILLLFVRIIFTWFPIDPWSKMARVVHWLAKMTDPILVPIRRHLPPLRIGGVALDLSSLVVLIVLEIVVNILRSH